MLMASRKERWREGPGQAQVGGLRVNVFYGQRLGPRSPEALGLLGASALWGL